MRAVLFQTAPWRPDMPAPGLPYIAGALRAAGHAVSLVDLNFPLWESASAEERALWHPSHHYAWYGSPQFDRLLDRAGPLVDQLASAALAGPDRPLVGITLLATQKRFALWLADRVRRLRPDARIVCGGPQCFREYEPEAVASHPSVDAVVVGEGERAVVDLAAWLEGGGLDALRGGGEHPMQAVPAGVIAKAGNTLVHGPVRALDKDIDRIPFPDYTGLPMRRYTDAGRMPLFTSRGCVKKCVFCIEQRIWERFRYRSADNVFAEIRQGMERWGATRFEFNDSLFNGHMRVLEQLCDLLIAAGLRPSWGGQGVLRAEMTPRLLAKLKAAGCDFITYGFESASQRVLDAMHKNVDMGVAARVVRDTHAAGIGQKLNLMFGFPGETEADFQLTLDFLTQNARFIDEVNPSDAFTAIIEGTELYDRAAEYGVTAMHNSWFWEADGGTNNFEVRLERFERLCAHVRRLGIKSSYAHERVVNRHQALGDWALWKGRHHDALAHYREHAAQVGVAPESVPNWFVALDGHGEGDLAGVRAGVA
jgi:radical SAM superfamily enzyme YgiQ (UPF0313 family)